MDIIQEAQQLLATPLSDEPDGLQSSNTLIECRHAVRLQRAAVIRARRNLKEEEDRLRSMMNALQQVRLR